MQDENLTSIDESQSRTFSKTSKNADAKKITIPILNLPFE